jgi:hypothetical protein
MYILTNTMYIVFQTTFMRLLSGSVGSRDSDDSSGGAVLKKRWGGVDECDHCLHHPDCTKKRNLVIPVYDGAFSLSKVPVPFMRISFY